MWGSERCSVTVDNHSLIYLSKTLSSHTARAKQFLLSLPPSSFSASNYKLEGYFSSGQKHCPPALPLSSDHPLFLSLSCPYSLSQQLQSGNEQAVNTHHLALCVWKRISVRVLVCTKRFVETSTD